MSSFGKSSLFTKVRKILDENGYIEPLSPEGIPLVNRLIQDLILKNKNLKEAEASLKECKEKCDALNVSAEPLREENGRVLQKLSDLHMENIKLKECNDKLNKDLGNATRKLEIENRDLQFVIGELKRKIETLEDASSKKSDLLLQLQNKKSAIVAPPAGSGIVNHRQRMDISSPLEMSKKCLICGCGNLSTKNDDRYLADLLKMTNQRIESLQNDVEAHKQNTKRWEESCDELKKKVENRESEISRLQMLLEGGRPLSAIVEDNKIMAAHSKLHQLQLKNDVLAKRNTHLELKLKSLLGDTHDAMSVAMAMEVENKDLVTELQNVTTSNRLLKQDCSSTADALTFKLARNKEKLKSCEGDLVEQHSLYHVTRNERDRLKNELTHASHLTSRFQEDLSHLREELSHSNKSISRLKEERHHLEEVLGRNQAEKKNMADRINVLTVQIQELEMEKTSLKSETGALRSNIALLEKNKTDLETSHSLYKVELEKIGDQKQEIEREKVHLKGEMAKLQTANEQKDEELRYFKDKVKELEEKTSEIEEAKNELNEDTTKYQEQIVEFKSEDLKAKKRISELKIENTSLEQERDHYSEQIAQLLDLLKLKPSSARSDQINGTKLRPEEELSKAIYERDLAKQELGFYRTQVNSLQNQIQRLKRGAISQKGDTVDTVDHPVEFEKDTDDFEKLRSEKNFYEDQMKRFQRLYNELKQQRRPFDGRETSEGSSLSPIVDSSEELRRMRNELRVCEQEKDFFREQYERLKSSLTKPLSPSASESLKIENLIRERDALKFERDFFKNQYKDLSTKISEFATESPTAKEQALKQELKKVFSEKKVLALAKAQLEGQLVDLRDDVVELEREKGEMRDRERDLAKTISNLENVSVQKFPPSMQNFIGEIRRSRDAAIEEVERVKKEKEFFRGKVKTLTAEQVRDKSTTEEDVKTLHYQKEESENMAMNLKQRVRAEATLISSLQNQNESLQEALQQTQTELQAIANEAQEHKNMLEVKERELETRSNQLTDSRAKIEELEKDLAELQRRLLQLNDGTKLLKENLTKIDNDKDVLTTELDSKSEFIETLKKELSNMASQNGSLEAKVTRMQAAIDSYEAEVEVQKRKVVEESERSDRFQQDLAVSIEQRDSANKEIRRLQKENIGQANEMKELQAELERTRVCRENFKMKAQEYCRTLENLNVDIANKDKEQDALMQDYLTLNEKVVSLKSQKASLEESAATQNQQMSRLEEMISKFKDEREALVSQVNDSMKKAEQLENKLHTLEQDKFELEKELLSNKDVTQKIDARRTEADAEVKRLTTSFEKIAEDKKSLDQELQLTLAQLTSERNAIRSLEEVLAEKRKAEFLAESTVKQLEMEKIQLHRKVSELSSELESESAEGKRLRSRMASLELDAERFKRQLTNEQYERERIEQELRRVRKFSLLSGALNSAWEGEVGRRNEGRSSAPLPSSAMSPTPSETADAPINVLAPLVAEGGSFYSLNSKSAPNNIFSNGSTSARSDLSNYVVLKDEILSRSQINNSLSQDPKTFSGSTLHSSSASSTSALSHPQSTSVNKPNSLTRSFSSSRIESLNQSRTPSMRSSPGSHTGQMDNTAGNHCTTSIPQNLYHIQPFIKPSITTKTFYSSLVDISKSAVSNNIPIANSSNGNNHNANFSVNPINNSILDDVHTTKTNGNMLANYQLSSIPNANSLARSIPIANSILGGNHIADLNNLGATGFQDKTKKNGIH